VPLVEAGQLEGPLVEDVVSRSLAPLLSQDVGIDTLLLGCTHYPLLAPVIRRLVGDEMAVIDSASATASALAGLLEIHALDAPPGAPAEHVQLTTGDVGAFAVIAERLFDSFFARVQPVAVAGAA
jgi:glutamate racemase